MPVDERSRHQLFSHLDQLLGPEDAATLIGYLPPDGGADMATKTDLEALKSRMDQRFTRVDERFERVDERFVWLEQSVDLKLGSLKNELLAAFRSEFNAQTKLVVFGLVSIVVTMATLAFALARFTG